MLIVFSDISLFGFLSVYSVGPPTGFLLDFQPSVDVVFEESFTRLVKMPDLIDVLDFVPELDGFRQFRAAPCPSQGTLLVSVHTFRASL